MQVRAFKLINGDEIIAEVKDTVSNNAEVSSYVLKRPLHLRAQMTPEGPQLGFFPWAMMLDESEEVILTHDKWFATYNVVSEVANDYIKNVTGLDVMSAPSKILYS